MKAEIEVFFVGCQIAEVLGHLLGTHAIAGDFLPRPGHLGDAGHDIRQQSAGGAGYGLNFRRGRGDDLFKAAVAAKGLYIEFGH